MVKKKEPNIFQKRKNAIDAASGWEEEPSPKKKAQAVKKSVKKTK